MTEQKLTKTQKKKIQNILYRLENDPNLILWIEMAFIEYDKAIKQKKKSKLKGESSVKF
ncbi:hypothetical protein [Leptospira fletcheri]|uniref:hypothetical protein n=1 Tax=Leptospira fletcheri TaxID=2484981 RepID=UPI0014382E28|nr:hypothetical protein [Leptospira fletcheri]